MRLLRQLRSLCTGSRGAAMQPGCRLLVPEGGPRLLLFQGRQRCFALMSST